MKKLEIKKETSSFHLKNNASENKTPEINVVFIYNKIKYYQRKNFYKKFKNAKFEL